MKKGLIIFFIIYALIITGGALYQYHSQKEIQLKLYYYDGRKPQTINIVTHKKIYDYNSWINKHGSVHINNRYYHNVDRIERW